MQGHLLDVNEPLVWSRRVDDVGVIGLGLRRTPRRRRRSGCRIILHRECDCAIPGVIYNTLLVRFLSARVKYNDEVCIGERRSGRPAS